MSSGARSTTSGAGLYVASFCEKPASTTSKAAPAASAPGPDRLASGGQLQARLAVAMQQLSPQERSAFVLRHCEEFSVDEIASTLKVAPGAARHSIFRAVQKLRRGLAAFVEAPL